MRKHKIITIISAILLIAASLLLASGCGNDDGTYEPKVSEVNYDVSEGETDCVLIEMADGSKMLIRLYPETAPITVANFRSLVGNGFYDGLTFHRADPGFVIQGGDPNGDGTGGSGTEIKGEFFVNGVQNDLSHDRGVVSMARKGYYNGNPNYNTATSQFFICLDGTNCRSLDGQYAAFGKVIAGMDTVDKIAASGKGDPCRTMASVKFVTVEE